MGNAAQVMASFEPKRWLSRLYRAMPSRPLTEYPNLPSSGLILELMGAQAVGKTTLSNRAYAVLKRDWFFRSHLQKPADAESARAAPEVEALLMEIYFGKLRQVGESDMDARRKLTIARQMSRVAEESLTLATHVYPRGFFLDEGLFKNFAREIVQLGAERTAPLWKSRAFVHVRARTPALVAARYQERAARRRERGGFQHEQSEAELCALIEREDAILERICETARSCGRPCAVVYVEDGLENNIRSILDFERSLKS